METQTSIACYFNDIRDPRIDRCKLHPLMDIITIAICAVIANADRWEDVAAYGQAKEQLLRTFLELPHGIPSHDTFERVFARIDPNEFQRCFIAWVEHIRLKIPGDVVAVDGKTSRGTRDTPIDLSPLHVVSAWSCENELVLGQVRTADKSNEITAIPLLLDILDVEGCIVTIDAMGCQTAIVEKIIENNADYVITCKGNQGHLFHDVETLFKRIIATPEEMDTVSYFKTTNAAHGRHETREYWSTSAITAIHGRERWKGLRSLAMVRSERKTLTETSVETRFFISSLPSDATKIAGAIRAHWHIENQLHWVLDVVFHEDTSRSRMQHTAHNFTILRHITMNMLRQETSLKKSIRQKRLRAGWDDAYMLKVLQADLEKGEQM